jgi:hypothetical protein
VRDTPQARRYRRRVREFINSELARRDLPAGNPPVRRWLLLTELDGGWGVTHGDEHDDLLSAKALHEIDSDAAAAIADLTEYMREHPEALT